MKERREFPRYYIPMSVRAQFTDQGKIKSEFMRLVNISRGGACLSYDKPLPPGARIELEVNDCDSGFINQMGAWDKIHGDLVSLKAEGEVLRNEEYDDQYQNHHVALEFSDPIKIIGY